MNRTRTLVASLAAAAVSVGVLALPAYAETIPTPVPTPTQTDEMGDPEGYLAWPSTGEATITHPSWGKTTVRTVFDAELRRAAFVVHQGDKVIWATEFADLSRFELASPAQDASGNVFITYDPGRHNGIIVLRPDAVEGFITLAYPYGMIDEGALNFYDAKLVGPGADGLYKIDTFVNDCSPSCAEGTVITLTYIWMGGTYVGEPMPEGDPGDAPTPEPTAAPTPTEKPKPTPTAKPKPAPKPTAKPKTTVTPKPAPAPNRDRGVPAHTGAEESVLPILPLAAGSLMALGSAGWLVARVRRD